jgi:hypothetical protein
LTGYDECPAALAYDADIPIGTTGAGTASIVTIQAKCGYGDVPDSSIRIDSPPSAWPAVFSKFLAAETVGSGPASGFLEVSDAYASSKAVQNFASPTATDFIFDSQSGRFIMGDGGILGHDGILAAGKITPSETTVGGTIWRENGSLMTDEWSGHYGQNWTPEIRQQFQNFMQQNGVNITHTPWGQ